MRKEVIYMRKTCALCGKVHVEVPGIHRYDQDTETFYWECDGKLDNGEQCNSTMTYIPDWERTLELIVKAYKGGK